MRLRELKGFFSWIGNQILPHFELLQCLVAQLEAETPSLSVVQIKNNKCDILVRNGVELNFYP